MSTRTPSVLIVFALLFSLGAAPLTAQFLYGSLVGTVEDSSGAAVPKATVQITNTGTGQTREVTTSDVGYSFTDLQPGTYSVIVSVQGFRTARVPDVTVTINTVARLNVRLQVGELSESVTVRADTVALQTDKADVHTNLGSREVTQLPISGYRNYQTLINLVPGSTPAFYQNAVIGSPARALGTQINGTTSSTNNTRLDGASNQRASLPHQTLYVPPVESIETVNVATNSFDADQGLAGGAAITVSTKSGTNELHGALWEHIGNSRLNAKNFFYLDERNPKNIVNLYGANLGGPIRRDKLFFFGSFEGLRERSNFSRIMTIPTAEMRAGNFAPYGVTIYDPQTGSADGSGRTPFSGNVVPPARQSAIARRMQEFIPAANQPGTSSNYFNSTPTSFNRDNYDLKINWNASRKGQLWGKYSAMNALVTAEWSLGAAGGTGMINGGGAGRGEVLAQVATLGGVYTFSPTFLMDGTISYSRDPLTLIGPDYGTNFGLDVLGIPGTNGPDIRQSGIPMFVVSGFETFGNGHEYLPKLVKNNYWAYTANFGWNRSSHDMRFGIDITRWQVNQWHPETGGNGPRGRFNFDGGITALRGGAAPNMFHAWAGYLLGLPSSMGKSIQAYDSTPRIWMQGLYFRDRWQATRKLTLTLGLRWEYFPVMSRASTGIERYDWETNDVFVGGLGSVPRNAGVSASRRHFAPRLGIAYRLGPKDVIRAGYGISIDPYPWSTAESLLFPYPVIVNTDFNSNALQTVGPIASGIPTVVAPDLSTGVVKLPTTATTVTIPKGTFDRGYIQSFNFTYERQLPGGFTGSAGYVGTRTIHQNARVNINASTPGGGQDGRPLALKFGRRVDTNVFQPFQTATYDSLQTRLDRQFGAGSTVRVIYTWAKAINWTDGAGGTLTWNDPAAMYRNRAVAGYDRTHMFRAAWVYVVPFSSNSRITRALLGGWQVNGIFSAYTGTPFTVAASGTSLNAPGNTQTADQIKPVVEKLGGVGRNVAFYDPLAFASVTEVRYGTSGRNILRGPGVVNLDAGLARNFSLTERWKLQFRAEAFNLSNTPHFANPSTNVSNVRFRPDGTISDLGNFLSITSALSAANSTEAGERQFRFALRISF
jgi:hypothetical protein